MTRPLVNQSMSLVGRSKVVTSSGVKERPFVIHQCGGGGGGGKETNLFPAFSRSKHNHIMHNFLRTIQRDAFLVREGTEMFNPSTAVAVLKSIMQLGRFQNRYFSYFLIQ